MVAMNSKDFTDDKSLDLINNPVKPISESLSSNLFYNMTWIERVLIGQLVIFYLLMGARSMARANVRSNFPRLWKEGNGISSNFPRHNFLLSEYGAQNRKIQP